MKNSFFLFLVLTGLCFNAPVKAQVLTPSHWSFSVKGKPMKPGDIVDLVFSVRLDKTWHLYSNDFDPNVGPKVAVFQFEKSKDFVLMGPVKPIGAEEIFDDIFGGKVRLFHHKAEFRQKVKVLKLGAVVKGSYECQSCSDEVGKCVDQDGEFEFGPLGSQSTGAAEPVKTPVEATKTGNPGLESGPEAQTDSLSGTDTANTQVSKEQHPEQAGNPASVAVPKPAEPESLLGFFFAAFLSGLLALITPCVFPMIPMTVTFFTRQSKHRAEAVGKAALYGFSIIALYVLIGIVVSRINGPEFANFVSTHWAPNLFFFGIFIFFGLSFLGLFEIVLPSSLVNMADRESDKGGIYGIFFMAFTIVLVSFSCTGPIVSTILVESAGGVIVKPIVGMLGYSLAFALPFSLFAIFPQWLSSLPKSGGWLNSVKVVLGFLELAFALKFLSIPDLAYHWNLLDREIYLAFWIVIFTLMGYYLLGRIRLPHDSHMEKVPVLRLLLAIIVLSFVVYMIPGMWGAPLKLLSGYLPPQHTMDFNLDNKQGSSSDPSVSTLCAAPKHADKLHFPPNLNLKGYFDLKQALACAKEKNKPVFIDFTGHGCVNCREMEANVWSAPEVKKRLQEDFIMTALYVDDKTELPESDWYTSPYDGKVKKTIGKQNADLQVREYKNNAQPLYVLLSPDGKMLVPPRAYDRDIQGFVDFLEAGKANLK